MSLAICPCLKGRWARLKWGVIDRLDVAIRGIHQNRTGIGDSKLVNAPTNPPDRQQALAAHACAVIQEKCTHLARPDWP